MHATCVVIVPEFAQLSHQVHGIPEEYPIKVLTPDRADQALNERMRNRGVRNRLDLVDLDDPQVGESTVKTKERVVVGADVFRWGLARNGVIEHSTYADAVDVGTLDAKTDDAAAEHVHDDQHPVTT